MGRVGRLASNIPTHPSLLQIQPCPERQLRKSISYWHKTGICGIFTRAALRIFQFVLAVTVAGLYGVDLHNATKTDTHARSEWIYAEIVAALSVVTCTVHCFVTIVHVAWSTWDGVLFVLWLAQVGVFGTIYVSGQPTDDKEFATSASRMRVSVWLNLVNMVLWFMTFILGIAWCIRTRKVTRRTDQLDFDKEELTGMATENEGSLSCDVEMNEKKHLADIEKHGDPSKSDQEVTEAGSMMKKGKPKDISLSL